MTLGRDQDDEKVQKDWGWGGEADQRGLSCKHTVLSWDNGGACDEGHLQSVGRVKGNEETDRGTQGWGQQAALTISGPEVGKMVTRIWREEV